MNVYVGLDCGGSSSRVLAVDAEDNLVFQGQSGAANLVTTPLPRIIRNLTHAASGCPQATHVCGCFAGLIGDESRQRGLSILREVFGASVVRAEPDYAAAYASCNPGTDICVIAGTGSLVCSRIDGLLVKSGGRGYVLGDEGSAFHYGRDALLRYLDDPTTASQALVKAVQKLAGPEPSEAILLSEVYRNGTPAPVLAKLAPALATDARAGEPYAVKSLLRNIEQLAHVIVMHAERNYPGRRSLRIELAGGVWKMSPVFVEAMSKALPAFMEHVQVTVARSTKAPVVGAVELAKELN